MLLESDHLHFSPEECTPSWAHSSALNPTLPCGSGKHPVLILESQAAVLSSPLGWTDPDMLSWRGSSMRSPHWHPS